MFLKNTGISNFMKIRPVGTEWFDGGGQTGGKTDGRTNMTRLIVGFRNFTAHAWKFCILPTEPIYVL